MRTRPSGVVRVAGGRGLGPTVRRPRRRPAVLVVALVAVVIALDACAAPPSTGALPAADRPLSVPSPPTSAPTDAVSPAPGARRASVPERTAIASVARLGPLTAPPRPGSEGQRAQAAVDTVTAYLAAVVAMARTGDDAAFLDLTTKGCSCRALRPDMLARAKVGGVPTFDVRLLSVKEIDSSGTAASLLEAEYVIPAHIDPAAAGRPARRTIAKRSLTSFWIDFRSGHGQVDGTLKMRWWPA